MTQQRRRILVVEDDDIVRELMQLTLEHHGFDVTIAENGVEGFDSANNEVPDLIITDINMPGADGVHLVRRVRATSALEKVPVIITTGYGNGTATYTLAQGADAYEPKPIDTHSLLMTVQRLLKSKSANADKTTGDKKDKG